MAGASTVRGAVSVTDVFSVKARMLVFDVIAPARTEAGAATLVTDPDTRVIAACADVGRTAATAKPAAPSATTSAALRTRISPLLSTTRADRAIERATAAER